MPPVIGIVGGGVGGLTLARVLQVHGLNATIYELEELGFGRDQGGTLDLHEETGQYGMKEAGLLEKFLELARPEGRRPVTNGNLPC